jgi:hypothetical protein
MRRRSEETMDTRCTRPISEHPLPAINSAILAVLAWTFVALWPLTAVAAPNT